MILQNAFDLFNDKYFELYKNITIERVIIGIHFTAVQLSNGFCGVAAVDYSLINCCRRRNKDFGSFSPGKIHGERLTDLMNLNDDSPIIKFVKLASINAVSQEFINNSDYQIIEDKDPIDLIELNNNKIICIVGAFQSYIKKIAESSSKLIILELDKSAIPDEFQKHFAPTRDANVILPKSDVVIITGSTLVNDTVDGILSGIPLGKQVIIVGPTAGLFPELLFRHGVKIIGSTLITNPDNLFYAIAEGASGYHLFHNAAKKICIINDQG